MSSLLRRLHESTCPACGHHVAVDFFDGEEQPLATLGWPRTSERAVAMKKLSLAFVRCVDCGHVYNRKFNYQDVPYSDHPNLMFNHSKYWSQHLENVCDLILLNVPERPVIVEIGCGTGELLAAMAAKRPAGRFIGFDPNSLAGTSGQGIEARKELFDPAEHIEEIRPHLVMSRHVLEHLSNPLGFIQRLAFACDWLGCPTKLFLEVPCIDRAFAGNRTNDFYYEHNSHFSKASFRRMLERCAHLIHLIETAYNDEVVYGLVTVGNNPSRGEYARESLDFYDTAQRKKVVIAEQLEQLISGGTRIAIWGGTGKGAAFMNYFGLDAQRFSLVIDSDPEKAGTFVPGTGQEIVGKEYLIKDPTEMILIPTQWRARDIVAEIREAGISYETILIEHEGKLIDFHRDPNPYNMD